MPPVPGNPARQKAGVDVIGGIKFSFDRPIVGKIDLAPIGIIVRGFGRPSRPARFVRHVTGDVLVGERSIDIAEMEKPAGVEEERLTHDPHPLTFFFHSGYSFSIRFFGQYFSQLYPVRRSISISDSL